MTFHVIDMQTGQEPSAETLAELAEAGDLLEMDIEQFYVGENGTVILMDDTGNNCLVDPERFKVVVDTFKDTDEVIEESINILRQYQNRLKGGAKHEQ